MSRAADMFDLAFVGSGLSTSIVLRSFLEDLLERPRGVVIDVCVIEQGPDLFGGVAYGARSGATSRVISPLSEFLNDAERSRFVAWLSETSVQHPEILDDLTGAYTSTWIAENRRAIETGLCDDLFIPRSLFGRYLREAMERIIADATAAGAATIRFIHASVTDIDRTADGFRVATDGPDGQVESERVVLGIGTPSGRRVSETLTPAPGVLVVTDPYALGMQATIDRIAAHLERPGPRPIPPKLVIVGSNATMLDFVYQCEDDQRIAKLEPTYCVVSQSGTLPARYASPSDPVRELPHLEALKHRHDVRACDVVAAIDADRAHYRVRATPTSVKERNGDHDDGGWMIPAISRTIADLAAQLPPNERRIFANRTGAEIGRMQRRAGAEYLGIVDALKEAGRFVGVAASFESVASSTAVVDRWDVVIDASGPTALDADSPPEPLASLLRHGLASLTPARNGLVVDDRLEASAGLYVMGPLLAGNVVAGRPIWHLEHAGRIIEMATTLGRQIGQRFSR